AGLTSTFCVWCMRPVSGRAYRMLASDCGMLGSVIYCPGVRRATGRDRFAGEAAHTPITHASRSHAGSGAARRLRSCRRGGGGGGAGGGGGGEKQKDRKGGNERGGNRRKKKPPAGGGGPLGPQATRVESEDAAVYFHGAQRHPHSRSAENGPPPQRGVPVHLES